MKQNELNRSVAKVTGESRSEIARRGFSPLEPVPEEPEAIIIDWDALEQSRNCALFRAAS